ncbi:MAG: hypothetical protein IJV00_01915, partial [Clostridia bacterium]|nr:hypothetical protein [Clostridia bacterium]
PDDPVWNASPLMEANCDYWREPGPDGDTAYFRLLWDKNTLYINARLNKTFVSDPGRHGSLNCDCVRVYLTERPVRDTLTLWSDFTPDPGFLDNVKFFPEAKNIGGNDVFNTLPERSESRSFVDEKGFSVCAALKFAGKHSAGDIIGFNVEFNGVRAPGTRRAYSLNYVPETDALPCHVAPSSLAFAELA